MNEKLQEILENILENEQEAEKFAKLDTIEDIYSYLADKAPGLTEEEFENFIDEILEPYENNEGAIENLDESSLDDVSGGAGFFKKATTGLFAFLSLLPGVNMAPSASAKNIPNHAVANVRKYTKPKSVPKKTAKPAPKQQKIEISQITPKDGTKLSKIKRFAKKYGVPLATAIILLMGYHYLKPKDTNEIGSGEETRGETPTPEPTTIAQKAKNFGAGVWNVFKKFGPDAIAYAAKNWGSGEQDQEEGKKEKKDGSATSESTGSTSATDYTRMNNAKLISSFIEKIKGNPIPDDGIKAHLQEIRNRRNKEGEDKLKFIGTGISSKSRITINKYIRKCNKEGNKLGDELQ